MSAARATSTGTVSHRGRRHTGGPNLGLGCPGEGSPLIFAPSSDQTRRAPWKSAISLASRANSSMIDISIDRRRRGHHRAGRTSSIDTSLLQVSIDRTGLHARCAHSCRRTASDAEVTAAAGAARLPPGIRRLRIAVVDKSCRRLNSFGPGPVLHCKFRIQPGGAPQSSQIDLRSAAPRDRRPQTPSSTPRSRGGAIEINPRPPLHDHEMCPLRHRMCQGGECRPIIECDGPMAGPSRVPGRRQACVNGLCQCVGDCDLRRHRAQQRDHAS